MVYTTMAHLSEPYMTNVNAPCQGLKTRKGKSLSTVPLMQSVTETSDFPALHQLCNTWLALAASLILQSFKLPMKNIFFVEKSLWSLSESTLLLAILLKALGWFVEVFCFVVFLKSAEAKQMALKIAHSFPCTCLHLHITCSYIQ